jgi:hypothetical protein
MNKTRNINKRMMNDGRIKEKKIRNENENWKGKNQQSKIKMAP